MFFTFEAVVEVYIAQIVFHGRGVASLTRKCEKRGKLRLWEKLVIK